MVGGRAGDGGYTHSLPLSNGIIGLVIRGLDTYTEDSKQPKITAIGSVLRLPEWCFKHIFGHFHGNAIEVRV